jgi:hypothetical protein
MMIIIKGQTEMYLGLPDVRYCTGLSGILGICSGKEMEGIPDMQLSGIWVFVRYFVRYSGIN